MDTRTGDLFTLDNIRKKIFDNPSIAKWMKEIPSEFLPELEGMNRAERRAWYSKNRHRFNKVTFSIPTKTVEEAMGEE
jgi:hypothetical protein